MIAGLSEKHLRIIGHRRGNLRMYLVMRIPSVLLVHVAHVVMDTEMRRG